jgi:hypothetical protein
LRDLLLTTSAAAASIGLCALAVPDLARFGELLEYWSLLGELTWAAFLAIRAMDVLVATLVAAWATLDRRILTWRLVGAGVVAAVWPPVYVFAWQAPFFHDLGWANQIAWWRASFPELYFESACLFAMLAGSFLIVRLAGCRLVREKSDAPEKGEECDAKSSAHRQGCSSLRGAAADNQD